MSDTPTAAERTFWDWFQRNETRLFLLDGDSNERDAVLGDLSQALAAVSQDLTFEIGPGAEGRREFVLSAGGIKAAFPAVEALAHAGPELARWSIVKFRPRRNPVMRLTYGDKTVDPEDVDCCVLSNGEELGLYVFFHGYSEEQRSRWGQIGYLLLDEALGEYDVEMKVGLIDFLPFEAHPDAPRFPITELGARFDEHYAQLQH